MNLNPPSPKGGIHRTLRVLSLLVLQHALVPGGTLANARPRLPENPDSDSATDAESRPYLKVAGYLPLRFAAAPRPIPILAIKQPASSNPTLTPATPDVVLPTPAPQATESNHPASETTVVPPAPSSIKAVPSILPDDTHPSTRPEDFLPFFKFPVSGGEMNVVVPASVSQPPAPGQMPASSATYQQR